MPNVPGLRNVNRLTADQAVAASTTLVTLSDFTFTLQATKTLLLMVSLPFSVGATGGFKVQITSAQTLADYSASFEAIDGVTASPGAQVAATIAAQAAFANAWAVAGNHQINILGSFKGHATLSSLISLQIACNSAANTFTALKGAWWQIIQI